jgi:hypothetical protein
VNIGEANDLNIVLTYLTGRNSHPLVDDEVGDWPLPSVQEFQAAAGRLAGRAHRVLYAGWTAERLAAAWAERSAEADQEAQP